MPLLEIKNLQVEFGSGARAARAVDGVSLSLEAGKTLCLVGESGSGKSVTALSIAKLVPSPPARYVGGEILIEGRDVLKMSSRELRDIRGGLVSYVFQEPGASLNPVFRIGAQIKESLKYHRPAAANDTEVIRLLKLVGIPAPESRLRNYPHELSGGMQQRAAICRALVQDPDILLMDEPFGALDALTREEMCFELLRIWSARKKTILFVTHSIAEAVLLSDRVVVMTPRPGTVASIESVNLPRPRTLESMAQPEFQARTQAIRRIIYGNDATRASSAAAL